MPEELFDRDHLGSFLQQIRGECVTQAMTTGDDPGRLRIALHLLLDRLDGERLPRPLPIPEQIVSRDCDRALSQTLSQAEQGVRRDVDAPILAPFALPDEERLLLPVYVRGFQACRFRDSQPTA